MEFWHLRVELYQSRLHLIAEVVKSSRFLNKTGNLRQNWSQSAAISLTKQKCLKLSLEAFITNVEMSEVRQVAHCSK